MPRTQYIPGQFDSKGMFNHPDAQASAERVLIRMTAPDSPLPPAFDSAKALPLLVEIADFYWTAVDRKHPDTLAQVKTEIERFRKKASNFAASWTNLSPAAKAFIGSKSVANDLLGYRLPALVKSVEQAIHAVPPPSPDHGGRPSNAHVDIAVSRLLELWLTFAGGAPSGMRVQEASGTKPGPLEFVELSHRFVELAMRAIDRNVAKSSIKAAINRARAVKPRLDRKPLPNVD